jgi:hypothetical protein
MIFRSHAQREFRRGAVYLGTRDYPQGRDLKTSANSVRIRMERPKQPRACQCAEMLGTRIK